ncbi:MAG: efflux transporter outer membrane subunit [Verrucomicrobia bacterium]|nr:efflux transporter outer membrane subunit [Verrucomicrobiota bacterium]MBS0645683.1 efflux transporter outer membrane subunit [Verrucomicrobiota bacterium]
MRLFIILVFLAGCTPMRQPQVCLPEKFTEGDYVGQCGGETTELATWWEQFQDNQLSELIVQAIGCNHDLRITRERICEARANFGTEFSRLMPYVDAFASYERLRNSDTLAARPLFLGGTFIDVYQIGFDSIWEIDLFGKITDRAHAAALDIMAQKELVRDVHVSVVSEVAKNYFILRNLQDRIAITQRHIDIEEHLVAITQDRFNAGFISELDLYTAKATLEERYSDLYPLEMRFKQTVYSIAVLLGLNPESLEHCFDEVRPIPCVTGKIPLGLPSELLCRRGDVRQAEYNLYAAGARVCAARKELFPTLSLEGMFEFASGFFTKWFQGNSRQWTISPSLTLPLFHGGQIRSWIAAATSRQWQAALAYEQSVLNALKEVESTLVAYFEEGARVSSLQEEVENYRNARDLAETLYLGGKVDFLYLIQVERDLYNAEILLSITKEDMMTSLVAVYKSLGGGWEC